ncbi:uncharacterized protein LOC132066815 [Lycium ferocissimum]|uniref:uncharacterized protein LOC132066815 n=1 Tax=Lycium ferocissimum TaxID=112874 RepID=UPI0028162349|nr:uncharacterized protein LOC132066815 [Lycium ferocissimum]
MFLVLLCRCAVAAFTYSAVHASYGKPINLISSIKSIRNSFVPLLSTFIVSHVMFISITLLFALVLVFSVQILQALGFIELKYDFNHLLFFAIFALAVLEPFLLWLQVNWFLAYVVALVESKWGFETLRRISYLVKGKRPIVMSMMVLYGFMMGFMMVGGSIIFVIAGAAKGNQLITSFGVMFQIMQSSLMGYVMMNQYLVGNVVLYMYYKDLNGENLPSEIRDVLASKYISLPLDLDDENNHGIVQLV